MEDQSQMVAAALLAESSESDVEPDNICPPQPPPPSAAAAAAVAAGKSAVSGTAAAGGGGTRVGRSVSGGGVESSQSRFMTSSQLLEAASGGYDADRLRRSLSSSGTDPAARASRVAAIAASGFAPAGGGERAGKRMSSHAAHVEAVMRISNSSSNSGRVQPSEQSVPVSRGVSMAQRSVIFKEGGGQGGQLGGVGVRVLGSGGSLSGSQKQQEAVLQKAAQLLAEDSD
jgi:hypothetical protein